MKIMFKSQTVEELQAEIVRFIRFRAEQELKNGRAIDRTLAQKTLTLARARALESVANTIAQAELLKDAAPNYNSPAKPC